MLTMRVQVILSGAALFVAISALGEHSPKLPTRPKVSSRASECSKAQFESTFGLTKLEEKLKPASSVKPTRSLLPIEALTETRYGSGGMGPSMPYEVTTAWRYQAPDNRVFRLAVSDSLACFLLNHKDSSDTLSSFLNQDNLFSEIQPNGGKLKKDGAPRPEDLEAYKKMRELFGAFKTLVEEHQGKNEYEDFFQAFFKQIQKTEASLLSKNPKLEMTPELLKQIEKLRTEGPQELFSFVKQFSQSPEFDYWLHPILANYFRKALNDPGFSIKPSDSMTPAQAQDLGREFQKILRGAQLPGDIQGPTPADPVATQGRIVGSQIVSPRTQELLSGELEHFSTRLRNPDKLKQEAARLEAAQGLARALNPWNETFGGALSPEHLALRDAAQGALTSLTGKHAESERATSLEGEEARVRDETERTVLNPLRLKLEAGLKDHKYPITLDALERVSHYPDSTKELIQWITRRMEPSTLSRKAQGTIDDFLRTGESQHLIDLLFKNRDAFEGAVGFISSAKAASSGDQALVRATSLLSKLNAQSLKPQADWAEDYAYTRRLLIDSISKLAREVPPREKDRDAHLLALRLLDEVGLVGVTDRDTKEKDRYLPEDIYQELRAEQVALARECEGQPDRKDCMQKLETNLLQRAHAFVGSPTGLTSEIRKNLIERFPSASYLHRYDHLSKGSPLRQSGLFLEAMDPEKISELQTSEVPAREQNQRIESKDEKEEDPSQVALKLPQLFEAQRKQARLGSELAQLLSNEFANAAAGALEEDPEKREALQKFYQCLSERLIEQTSEANNPLALRALSLWYSDPASTAQSKRLKLAAYQLECPVPEGVEEAFLPPEPSEDGARSRIQTQAGELEGASQQQSAILNPGRLTEKGLIELEHLRRLEIDIKRESLLFGGKNNPVLAALLEKRKRVIENLRSLGLASALENPDTKALLAPPSESALLTRKELEALETEFNVLYDSETNSILITPESKINQKLFSALSRAQGMNLRYLGPGQESERFIANAGNAKGLLALLAHEAASMGITPLSTRLEWNDFHKLDLANPDGKPIPKWFPITDTTSARLIQKDGKTEAEFVSTASLSEEARKKMDALIQARTAMHSAAAEYGGIGHAAKAYFGSIVGYDPNKTTEVKNLQEAYAGYANLRAAFGSFGILPISGTQMTTAQFNKNETQMMKDYLHREDEAIHAFLTNVDTLHSLTEMALTSAIPIGNVLALEAALAKVAVGSGKAAMAAKVALQTTRLAIQLRNATRAGLMTAGTFEGVSTLVEGGLSLLPDSAHSIVEDRIKRAKNTSFEEGWRKHPTNPAFDSKWGALDPKSGQPIDPKLRKEFLQAMLEFNIEESMDIDGDGVIDELQGPGGTPVPFAKRRTFAASLTDPHRLQGLADSAAFFRNLNMAKALPIPRWITLPTEMALASGVQEATRSQESLRWEEKQSRKDPGSFSYRVGKAALGGLIEGGRFGISGTASNAALTRIAGGRPGHFNTFLGGLLFAGVDSVTKAAVNQAQYGQTGFERGSWEEFFKDLVKDNAVSFYIGLGISKSGLSQGEHRELKQVYLEGGEVALKKALEKRGKTSEAVSSELSEGILSSVSPQEFAGASRSVQETHLRLLESRITEANKHLEAAQRASFRAGEEVILPQEARRVAEINRDLLRLFREGSWNHGKEIAELMKEQDRIFARVTESLDRAQKESERLESRLLEEAASSDPKVQAEFERKSRALEAHQELISHLTEGAAQMAPLRLLAAPVETIAALSDPRSNLAERHFDDRPAALAALQRYQKSVGEQAWEQISRFGEALVREHVAPDLRRSDSGQGGIQERIVGARPTSGITGREQRAAAEFVERVFKDKKTSLQEKRELLGILLQLDPARADALAKSQTWDQKSK